MLQIQVLVSLKCNTKAFGNKTLSDLKKTLPVVAAIQDA